jgi:hypothetical protein
MSVHQSAIAKCPLLVAFFAVATSTSDLRPVALSGEEEGKRRQAVAPAFVSPQAFRAATLAASGYGGERQSRRECRLGD